MMIAKQERVWVKYLVVGFVIALLLVWMAGRTFGQSTLELQQNGSTAATVKQANETLQPVYTGYKGVKIGVTADAVKAVLDEKPKSDDGNTLLYVFSDGEMAQIALDQEKKVRLIAVTYSGKEAKQAPSFESVFGPDVELKETPDGRVYKMVRYPDEGYWIAYSTTPPTSDDRMVAITIQKLDN